VKKPLSIKVVAGVFIFTSFLMIVGSISGLGILYLFKNFPLFSKLIPAFSQITPLTLHFSLLLSIQLGAGILILVASFHFLQGKGWARTTLEVFTWLGLLYVIVFTWGWLRVWEILIPQLEKLKIPNLPSRTVLSSVGKILAGVIFLLNFIPLILILKFLRKIKFTHS